MSKNRRILIISIILGSLFTTINTSAFKIIKNKNSLQNKIIINNNYKKKSTFSTKSKNKLDIKNILKINNKKIKNKINNINQNYIEKNQESNNFIFEENTKDVIELKELLDSFNQNTDLLYSDAEKLMEENDENIKTIEERYKNLLYSDVEKLMKENDENIKTIEERYKNIISLFERVENKKEPNHDIICYILREIDVCDCELSSIKQKYENIYNVLLNVKKTEENKENFKRFFNDFEKLFSVFLKDRSYFRLKIMKICEKILLKIYFKYINSKKEVEISYYKDILKNLKYILISLDDIKEEYYTKGIKNINDIELFENYNNLFENYAKARCNLITQTVDVAEEMMEGCQKYFTDQEKMIECGKLQNNKKICYENLEKINYIDELLSEIIEYFNENIYSGYKNDLSEGYMLLNLLYRMLIIQKNNAISRKDILLKILNFNKFKYLKKLQLKYPNIINKSNIELLEKNFNILRNKLIKSKKEISSSLFNTYINYEQKVPENLEELNNYYREINKNNLNYVLNKLLKKNNYFIVREYMNEKIFLKKISNIDNETKKYEKIINIIYQKKRHSKPKINQNKISNKTNALKPNCYEYKNLNKIQKNSFVPTKNQLNKKYTNKSLSKIIKNSKKIKKEPKK